MVGEREITKERYNSRGPKVPKMAVRTDHSIYILIFKGEGNYLGLRSGVLVLIYPRFPRNNENEN